ncbi:hypothetical protein EI94DRAFT_1726438 [Lactarius quietus]|nr:hypothetical protein EI94DRAFT_1751012 [Lactarius quietus]KAF8268927.1 hypothetical protein EI94DRAFT_1726438 [Lactarius quietus]
MVPTIPPPLVPLPDLSHSYRGQSFETRIRTSSPPCIVEAVREVWDNPPLFVWLSATYWAEGPEKDSQRR